MRQVTVSAFWDDEANVWVAESDDVLGLVTEAESIEKLTQKLQVLIPELIGLAGGRHELADVHLRIERHLELAV
jgi:predicted RNase H-like HicB family nuclease